ncbi:MAG TPA: alpha-hydroxy-acid oxidizing protein [Verrucomicrobiae bacterium]|nr:alpha-hydroxy-acid oxidizing protein [Verrucomicrobiae bacterium]
MSAALNLRDLEQVAREKLPTPAFDYYSSGAWDEIALKENRDAFSRIPIYYRVLVDVSRRDLSVKLADRGHSGMGTARARRAQRLPFAGWPERNQPPALERMRRSHRPNPAPAWDRPSPG